MSRGVSGGRARFKRWAEKYVMFVLPFVTVLREGLEAIVLHCGRHVLEPCELRADPGYCWVDCRFVGRVYPV